MVSSECNVILEVVNCWNITEARQSVSTTNMNTQTDGDKNDIGNPGAN